MILRPVIAAIDPPNALTSPASEPAIDESLYRTREASWFQDKNPGAGLFRALN
jgi:hypothetical protein